MTVEQITAEITAKPELKTAILSSLKNEVIEAMKAEGTVIRTKDEETQYITNYETNVIPGKVQAEIGAKIKAVHDQYDQDLFTLLGEKKLPTEKTYDFMKRKLAELTAKKGAGNDDPVLADQIKDLTAKLKERESYVSPDEVDKLKGKYFTEHVDLRLTNAMDKMPIAVPAHITDDKAKQQYIETQRRFIKVDFMQKYKAKQDDKGNIVFYDGDKLLTDSKTAAPKTESDLIAESYSSYFIPAKAPAKGAGSRSGGNADRVDVNEATLKTKKEVIEHLTKKGLTSGGADFNKEYVRILKDYGITEPGE